MGAGASQRKRKMNVIVNPASERFWTTTTTSLGDSDAAATHKWELPKNGKLRVEDNVKFLFTSFSLDFENIRRLGSGSFGDVRLVRDRNDSRLYAAKVFFKTSQAQHKATFSAQQVLNEVNILSSLRYSTLLPLHAVYEERDRFTLLMDYCEGGSLLSMVAIEKQGGSVVGACKNKYRQKGGGKELGNVESSGSFCITENSEHGTTSTNEMSDESCCATVQTLDEESRICSRLSEQRVAEIMCDLLASVAYLHANGVVHRDIKIDNILVRRKRRTFQERSGEEFVLADFGLASFIGKNRSLSQCCGSPLYMAPEVIRTSSQACRTLVDSGCPSMQAYDKKCDVWSAGVVMFVLLTGTFPFTGESVEDIFNQILNDDLFEHASCYSRGSEALCQRSSECRKLLQSLLEKSPVARPSAIEVLQTNSWLLKFASQRAQTHLSRLKC
uniref:Protein kinase domain-containing protein n=1 Tax=Palpitomonas bilix TaxID=652834 RepID=A0A7S3CV26_9EUKA|mmetsp:Transcript_10323/g.27064  ORF Transcript_10323/g.27064 Transcript_10323/m.27064 type:complete len:443 (+) Transcript_10323:48-1376(+)